MWAFGVLCLLAVSAVSGATLPASEAPGDPQREASISKRQTFIDPYSNEDDIEDRVGAFNENKYREEEIDESPGQGEPEEESPTVNKPTFIESIFSWPPNFSWLPTFSLPPGIALPSFQLPTFELPNFQLPAFQLPTFQLPTFQLPNLSWPSFLGGQARVVSYSPNYYYHYARNPNFRYPYIRYESYNDGVYYSLQ